MKCKTCRGSGRGKKNHCKGDMCMVSWRMGGCECDCSLCMHGPKCSACGGSGKTNCWYEVWDMATDYPGCEELIGFILAESLDAAKSKALSMGYPAWFQVQERKQR